jgi:16S rRNA G966 N2-methylase RsmD
MLADEFRSQAYFKALKKYINNHSIVLDVGSGTGFLSAISLHLGAKKVIAIEETNTANCIKPILNQLKFQKKIDVLVQNSIDYVDDADIIEEAQDAGTKLTNTLRELDSLVYTIIFIPSEDGSVTPTQEKYRKQTYDVCDRLSSELDKLLRLGGDSKEYEKAKVEYETFINTVQNKSIAEKEVRVDKITELYPEFEPLIETKENPHSNDQLIKLGNMLEMFMLRMSLEVDTIKESVTGLKDRIKRIEHITKLSLCKPLSLTGHTN